MKAYARRLVGLLADPRSLAVLRCALRHSDRRRVQEVLPGLRPDRVAEQGVVVAALQPVGAAVLLVARAPTGKDRCWRRVVDDRSFPDRRADQGEPATSQHPEQGIQGLELDDVHDTTLSPGAPVSIRGGHRRAFGPIRMPSGRGPG